MSAEFDFGPMLDAHVARFTVAFIKVDSEKPELIGSGTLAKCRVTQGILTCGHVFQEIAKQKSIGICLFPVVASKLQQTQFETSRLSEATIQFYQPQNKDNGPDIAFISLSKTEFAALESVASSVDLDLQAELAANQAPQGSRCIQAVAGAVAEMTPPARIEDKKHTLQVEGLINVGKIEQVVEKENFDLLQFEPTPQDGFELPHSYGGSSGGGIWELELEMLSGEAYRCKKSRLVGVAFWQTDAPNRKLIGHGPISIYVLLLTEILSRFK